MPTDISTYVGMVHPPPRPRFVLAAAIFSGVATIGQELLEIYLAGTVADDAEMTVFEAILEDVVKKHSLE